VASPVVIPCRFAELGAARRSSSRLLALAGGRSSPLPSRFGPSSPPPRVNRGDGRRFKHAALLLEDWKF
jgi:hypothetical protein